jgi:sugar phosphate isomerase/epimerase
MHTSRRGFLKNAAIVAGSAFVPHQLFANVFGQAASIPLFAHLWVYASKFPPNWDSTPALDQAFKEIKAAGFAGIELMEVNLRRDDGVDLLGKMIKKYGLPVSGTSYNANMWDRERHDAILQDVVLVTGRLHQLGGKTLGISVGDAGRKKTDSELDIQAATLNEILNICAKRGIAPNMHNHTYELRDGMHDLRETMLRVPELKLGPDLNWLMRGGVDPVAFINQYGHRMAYMHLRDQRADGKWTEAVGEGITDFKGIANALKKINYSGMAAVELAYDTPVVRTTAENWQRSREFVKRVFGW